MSFGAEARELRNTGSAQEGVGKIRGRGGVEEIFVHLRRGGVNQGKGCKQSRNCSAVSLGVYKLIRHHVDLVNPEKFFLELSEGMASEKAMIFLFWTGIKKPLNTNSTASSMTTSFIDGTYHTCSVHNMSGQLTT